MKTWTAADIPSQRGKLAVVTGATGGLGYETALALAGAGAEVLVTGRNVEKGRVAMERIKRAVPSAKARFEMLDLASLASVRAFAAQMIARRQPLDLLISAAEWLMKEPRILTSTPFTPPVALCRRSSRQHLPRRGRRGTTGPTAFMN